MGLSYTQLAPAVLAGKARLAIENTLAAPEIAELLAPPYTTAVLEAALADVAALETAAGGQVRAYGAQKGATDAVDAAWQAFHDDTYMPHAGLARAEFADEPGLLTALGLDGEREKAFYRWVGQVRQFYTTALEDEVIAARLAGVGLEAAELEAAAAALEALAKDEQRQEGRKGLAQQSTHDRDGIRRRVAKWLGKFRGIAEEKLRAHPEWLERLGFLHRSDDPPDDPE